MKYSAAVHAWRKMWWGGYLRTKDRLFLVSVSYTVWWNTVGLCRRAVLYYVIFRLFWLSVQIFSTTANCFGYSKRWLAVVGDDELLTPVGWIWRTVGYESRAAKHLPYIAHAVFHGVFRGFVHGVSAFIMYVCMYTYVCVCYVSLRLSSPRWISITCC